MLIICTDRLPGFCVMVNIICMLVLLHAWRIICHQKQRLRADHACLSSLQLLNWMLVHSHAYRVPLGADQYKQLLSISYDTGGGSRSRMEACTCVRMIKNVSAHIIHLPRDAWAISSHNSSGVQMAALLK